MSGARIYVILGIEKISQSAGISVLKFMEEPLSQKVYGFLLTENIDDVLPTILSRSQIIHLKSIDEKDLEKELLELGVDEKIATLAPYMTKNLEEATQLAENPNFLEMIGFIETLVEQWLNKDVSYPLLFSKQAMFLTQDRDFFKSFLELLMLYFLDLIHYKAHQEITYVFLRDMIQMHSERMQIKDIHEIIASIQDIMEKQTYFINLELALDQMAYTLEKKR